MLDRWRPNRRVALATAAALSPSPAFRSRAQDSAGLAIAGRVTGDGVLAAARVSDGAQVVTTGDDTFSLPLAGGAADGDLRVTAAGYRPWVSPSPT